MWVRTLLFAVVGVLLAGGAGRLAYLEHSSGPEQRAKAARQQTVTISIPAQRGSILDTRGRVLAGSLRRPSVFVDPFLVADPRFAAYSVAAPLGLDGAELERMLAERGLPPERPSDRHVAGGDQPASESESKQRRFAWVKRYITDAELAAFEEVREIRRLWAFGVQYEPQRHYPHKEMAAAVIGFVSADREQRGLAGIELAFDEQLRGTPGSRVSIVDAKRRRLRSDPSQYVPPRDGQNIVLTIDAHIQQCVERHLREGVQLHKAQWGAAVVMDPLSGEILAMATYPGFDPNERLTAGPGEDAVAKALERRRNRAISDAFEPGSIFKPFIASPAVEAGVTRLDEVFAINGPARQFGSRTIRDVSAYGSLQLREVISRSSNIGMALLGTRAGNERLHEWVRRFGFGDPTGITLPGEHDGLVNDFASWGKMTSQSVPMGYEVAVTPLQMVTALSAIANDGVLYRPRIVRGVIGANAEPVWDNSRPIPVRRVLDASVARRFRLDALVEVVRSGTGKRAAITGYQVFGKTGTAKLAAPGGGYLQGAYVGSFIGGAPAHAPRATVVVSIYRPGGASYYGGTLAAPIAGAMLADTLDYMEVPRDPGASPDADARRKIRVEDEGDLAE